MLPIALSALLFAAPPGVPGPSLRAGDELVYTGQVVEENLRPAQKHRRGSGVEVRILVLGVRDGVAEVAVMTLLRPQDDAAIAKAAVEATGAAKESAGKPPGVQLALVRVGANGAASLLPALDAKTTTPAPGVELEEANSLELGAFVERPAGLKPGDQWQQLDADRPAIRWTAKPMIVLDSAEAIEVEGVQESAAWARPTTSDKPWRRHERVWLSPADGLARVVWRRVERHDGPLPALRIETRLDLKPSAPHRGVGFERVKREIEFAWKCGVECTAMATKERAALAAKIERYCDDYPETPYREAVLAVARRCR